MDQSWRSLLGWWAHGWCRCFSIQVEVFRQWSIGLPFSSKDSSISSSPSCFTTGAVRWYPTDDELQRMGMDRATYEAKYPHPNYELDFDSSSSSSSPSHPVPDDSTASTDPHTTFTQHSAIAEPEAQKPKSDGEEEQPLHLHNLTHSHPHKLRFHFFSSINANTSDLEIGRRSQEVEEKDEDRDEDEAERRMERDNEKKSMAVKKKKYEKKSKKSKLNVVRALPCPSALSRKFFALVFAGFLLLCVLLTLVLDFYYLIVFHDVRLASVLCPPILAHYSLPGCCWQLSW